MINVRILSMAIRTFFMANLDYAAAAGASCAVVGELLDVGPSFKEGHNVLDFGLQERVNWREEATGARARKRSTAAIHAAEGGTGTHAGTCAVNGAVETFVCMGTSTGTHVSARACAGRCAGTGTGVRISARAGACTSRCTGA